MGKATPGKKPAKSPRLKSRSKIQIKAGRKSTPKPETGKNSEKLKTRRPDVPLRLPPSPLPTLSLSTSPPPPFFIHPTAVVDSGVEIGAGTKIWHFSHVQTGAKIGKNCVLGQNVNVGENVMVGNFVKIQNNVSVYSGVVLEDYVFCGPSMVFTNIIVPRSKYPQRGTEHYRITRVKEGASLGANATIICSNTVGRFAFVGAGAVVTREVPDFALVVGNPARIVGWLSEAGEKLKFDADGFASCARSGRRYRLENGRVRDVTDEE